MVEEIRQDDKVILSSEDGFSVPMISTTFVERISLAKNTRTISGI